MSTFVSNITFKSDTYEGVQEYNPPLRFDNSKYIYFIKILNVRFSNNIPNIKTTLTLVVDGLDAAVIPVGLYEIKDLIDFVNASQSYFNFELSESNGHMKIINLDSASHVITGNMLTAIQFGAFASSVTLAGGQSLESPKMCAVDSSNFYKLCSTTINPCAYETDKNSGKMVTTNTLYTFAATIDKFGHKDFTAFQNVQYPIACDQFQRIDFSLTDENGQKLYLLDGAKSDFNVQAVIIKEKK